MNDYLLKTYNPLPIQFDYGDGVWLFDKKGRKYLDAFCGIAVTGLGHNHPVITKVIKQQAETLLHISNLVEIAEQQALAEQLSKASGMHAKIFFSNSGAEAIESAIKLSRLYGYSNGIEVPKIIVMSDAFHGRTLAALSASASRNVQNGFDPVKGFIRATYNDMNALRSIAKYQSDIAAVLLEPIQGKGGIQVPSHDYLGNIRELCDKKNWLLILDEIQTGMARTGQLFAYQDAGIIPDAVTLAKALGNGIPIGALLVRDKYCDLFKPGLHGSTFGGNPLSCAVGLATLTEIQKYRLWDNARHQGEKLIVGLQDKLKIHPNVKDIRGKGLMVGVELDRSCHGILQHALNHGILFTVTRGSTIRILPPLIIEDTEVAQIIDTIPVLIDEFVADS